MVKPKPVVLAVPRTLPDDASGPFEGWGTSLAWFAHAMGNDPATRDEIATLLFGADGLGLNIVRYNIGGADPNPAPEEAARFRAGGAVPCCHCHDGSFEPGRDEAQTAFLLKARELVPKDAFIAEAFANSPPHYLVRSGTSRGNSKPYRNNLARKEVPGFVSAMIKTLEHFRTEHGLTFDSLSPFNEPASPAWISGINAQEGCYFNIGRMNDVITALVARKEELGGTAIVAHEQFCVADAAGSAKGTPKRLWPELGRVNTHTYNSRVTVPSMPLLLCLLQDNGLKRASLRKSASRNGKSIWVSEFGTGSGAAALAEHIALDFATLRPTAWVYWQAVEQPGSSWGLLQAPFPAPGGEKSAAPPAVVFTPQYHVIKLLVRAVPRGARVFRVPALKNLGFGLSLGSGRYAFVVANQAKAKAPLAVRIDAASLSAEAKLRARSAGPVGADVVGLQDASGPPPVEITKDISEADARPSKEELAAAAAEAAAAEAAEKEAPTGKFAARVTLLDCKALDAEGAANSYQTGPASREVTSELEVGAGGAAVEVPPGGLAVIEVSAV